MGARVLINETRYYRASERLCDGAKGFRQESRTLGAIHGVIQRSVKDRILNVNPWSNQMRGTIQNVYQRRFRFRGHYYYK
jgi:hypothetical protein